ncbi:hypothetical protein DIX60_06130 [Streptococcus iniae]|uniref:hypothetical protein n=1 Tax=Streptococcus iniae TaxID=1346 RepID=UPI0008D913DA|nr:hypothetical protein [Streptococcus iniae]OHX27220.1 hypothetical protein BKX95_06120 [Streptococcus iniae]RLV27665.1 hypothetical protein DIX60_06130 [Streptococcus iniae]
MIRAYIINPKNNKGAWFDFPLYFGKLRRIGHSCSYDDPVDVLTIEGDPALRCGIYTLNELERLNAGLEGRL